MVDEPEEGSVNGHWFHRIVAWLDANNGAITATATVGIAVLTFFYVRYSHRQWDVMRSQLDAMVMTEGAILTTGKVEGDVADGALRLPLENHGRIPSAKTRVTLRVIVGLPVMVDTGVQKFGGENMGVAPGIGEAAQVALPVSLKLEPDSLSKVSGGQLPLFISGVIEYENGLGKPLTYLFCFMYLRREPQFPKAAWALCEDTMTPLLHAF